MIKKFRIVFLVSIVLSSCFLTKSQKEVKHNFFAIPFIKEFPFAIGCDGFEKNCDTSFYVDDAIIVKLINSRINKLKICSYPFSDVRLKILPKYEQFNSAICIDIAGKIRIGDTCYNRDSVILNTLLNYLPKNYK